jgi:hypothetical protein
MGRTCLSQGELNVWLATDLEFHHRTPWPLLEKLTLTASPMSGSILVKAARPSRPGSLQIRGRILDKQPAVFPMNGSWSSAPEMNLREGIE